MATDWAKYRLQVNAIAPGYFRTPLNRAWSTTPTSPPGSANHTPAGRWGEVPELIGAAVFLASAASSFVNGPHPLCGRRRHDKPITTRRRALSR